MVDEYTIYLRNESSATQIFWCFLERPVQLIGDENVFANSNINLAVAPQSPAINTFTIPGQYSAGAGASRQAVDLDATINSNIQLKASLDEQFLATYANVPPPMSPTLVSTGSGAGSNQISIESNQFDKENNEANGWFSNQTFGIQSPQGFLGMTWSPNSGQRWVLTPKLKFYVAIGNYGPNQLASWNTIFNNSVELIVPIDFNLRKVTVTYHGNRIWEKTPGAPATHPLIDAINQVGLVVKAQRRSEPAKLSVFRRA